jgi:prepilin-type N-terminal cleavage/methylation domain-containing protein
MKILRSINKGGYSLLELTVAIAVAGIVSLLLFRVYSEISKEFSIKTRTAQRIQQMIYHKKRIDRLVSRIENLKSCGSANIYWTTAGDSGCSLVFANNRLKYNGNFLPGDFEKFVFTLVTYNENEDTQYQLLRWDATLKTGCWIGGAREVFLDPSFRKSL